MILMLTDIVRVMDPWLTSGIEEDLGLSVKRHWSATNVKLIDYILFLNLSDDQKPTLTLFIPMASVLTLVLKRQHVYWLLQHT